MTSLSLFCLQSEGMMSATCYRSSRGAWVTFGGSREKVIESRVKLR